MTIKISTIIYFWRGKGELYCTAVVATDNYRSGTTSKTMAFILLLNAGHWFEIRVKWQWSIVISISSFIPKHGEDKHHCFAKIRRDMNVVCNLFSLILCNVTEEQWPEVAAGSWRDSIIHKAWSNIFRWGHFTTVDCLKKWYVCFYPSTVSYQFLSTIS